MFDYSLRISTMRLILSFLVVLATSSIVSADCEVDFITAKFEDLNKNYNNGKYVKARDTSIDILTLVEDEDCFNKLNKKIVLDDSILATYHQLARMYAQPIYGFRNDKKAAEYFTKAGKVAYTDFGRFWALNRNNMTKAIFYFNESVKVKSWDWESAAGILDSSIQIKMIDGAWRQRVKKP